MQFDCTGTGTFALIDGMGNILLRDICFMGSIVDDNRPDFICIIYPDLKLVFGQCGTRWIVGITQIDDIRCFFRKFRTEIIFKRTRHVNHIGKCLCYRVILPCSSCHDIGIHINGINRVTYSNFIILAENLLNITAVAFCTVRDKNFICCDITTAAFIIILRNCVPQKVVSQIRRISAECPGIPHLIHCMMQRINNSRSDRLGYISDSQTYHFFIRIRLLKSMNLLSNR